MGLLSWITGTSTADKVIDKVSNGLDSIIFTEQEKSDASLKRLDFVLEYMKATAPQNVSRRVIAVIIVALWAALIMLGVLLQLVGWTKDAEFIFQTLSELVNEPFMIVIGFYFLAHVVRAHAAGKG